MELILDNKTASSNKVYDPRYLLKLVANFGYTTEIEKPAYRLLSEEESNTMLLTYASKSFYDGWDDSDQEENDYWNSFLK